MELHLCVKVYVQYFYYNSMSGPKKTDTAITCPTLSSIPNGRVVFSTASPLPYGAIATYSCTEGYGLSGGDTVRTCGGDGSSPFGTWNGMVPTCEGLKNEVKSKHSLCYLHHLSAVITCSSLPDPTNARISFSVSSTPYSFGTMASYRCVSGFGLSRGDATRTCEGDGSSPTGVWSGVVPSCGGK